MLVQQGTAPITKRRHLELIDVLQAECVPTDGGDVFCSRRRWRRGARDGVISWLPPHRPSRPISTTCLHDFAARVAIVKYSRRPSAVSKLNLCIDKFVL